MAHEIYTYTLDQLDNLERNLESTPGKAILINITLSSGHVLFQTAVGKGTTIDNDKWVQRKVNTVLRFGKSSFYIGQKLRIKDKPIEQANFVSEIDYATHGGSVPLKLANFDSIIGALTISGLAQEEDHLFAIEILGPSFICSGWAEH
ncbi:hypothetical protein Cantr_01157 [Candida viswanathii]|uniref:Heme-degrading domain-containing protein n=1 Tax=Candida viswanathii TaxID=5486 RepID=A0A367YHQ8_9ASCO|nr:hypothetical protein Cantr_01157 [Candida viswanathii]